MEITPEIAQKLEQLEKKYKSIGQDLGSYLDGLLYSNPLYYWDYIKVDALLSLQQPRTDFPDETIFIVYHQITELYFFLTLRELEQLAHNGKNISAMGQDLGWNDTLTVELFTERVERINRYFEALTLSFDIMRTGMEKGQFLKFRMALLPASGFQAANYRRIEIACTDLKYLVHDSVRASMWNASLEEQLDNIYWKQGAVVESTGEKTLTLKHFEEKYMHEFLAQAKEYEHRNLWQKYLGLSADDRKNEKLVRALRSLDVHVNVNWPLVHYKTAARYMAREDGDVPATGGTNWQKYLPPRFQKRIFYPELWTEQEKENWGKEWVEDVISRR
jgi:tryptophan 2,3-dioxygenase